MHHPDTIGTPPAPPGDSQSVPVIPDYDSLFRSAHDGICIVDGHGAVVYANPGLGAILGRRPAELIGDLFFSYLHPDDAFEARTRFAAWQRGKSGTHEVRLRRSDGTFAWALKSANGLTTADGVFAGALYMLTDVTERKAGEEALARSERHFRALIEHAWDMVTVLDARGRIDYASPSWASQTGYSPDAVRGIMGLELVHPDDADEVREAFRMITSSPQRTPLLIHYRFRDNKGEWRVLSSVMTNLLDDDSVRGVVVNSQDVTEREGLQRQYLHSQKLEAIGRLTGSVAHDFNNVLTVITSYAGMLLMDLPADHPMRADVKEIEAAALRAAALTRQLLAFSRQQVMKPREIDAGELVLNMAGMLERLLSESITLELRVADERLPVIADPGRLEQVLMNLTINAADAMPDGGRIVIEAADDERMLEPGRRSVRLSVVDEGIGMDEATQKRIFEPFFTTKELGKGTGLGLSTVAHIVATSGGQIAVESAPREGSTFTLLLPRGDMHAQPLPGVEAAAGRPLATEVLLVEDDPQLRKLVAQMLESRGFRVVSAPDAEEALAVVRGGRTAPDILVTDVRLPAMGGQELAEELRSMLGNIPVLFMTGYSVGDLGGQDEGGRWRVLSKPFESSEFVEAVASLLDVVPR